MCDTSRAACFCSCADSLSVGVCELCQLSFIWSTEPPALCWWWTAWEGPSVAHALALRCMQVGGIVPV